jgi:hypothetical protein
MSLMAFNDRARRYLPGLPLSIAVRFFRQPLPVVETRDASRIAAYVVTEVAAA